MNHPFIYTFLLITLLSKGVLFGDETKSGETTNESPSIVVPEEFKDDLRLPTAGRHVPFAEGEILTYTLGWGIFTAADAVLKTEVDNDSEAKGFSYELKTKTKGFINALYHVDNVSLARSDESVSRSLLYKVNQDEGGDKRQTEIRFNWTEFTTQYHNILTEDSNEPVLVMEGTFDPLSIVFYVRTLDFKVGDRIVIPTTNGKELFFTIVHVRDKVIRKFRSGKQEAYVLEPDIKDLGGVFKKSKDGRVTFYFSTDDRRLPLRMESQVAVGSFWAELEYAEVNGEVVAGEKAKSK